MDTLTEKQDFMKGISISEVTRRLLKEFFNDAMSDMAEEIAQGFSVYFN